MKPYWQTLREEADELESVVLSEDVAQAIRRTSIRAKRAEADRLEAADALARQRQKILDTREDRSLEVGFRMQKGDHQYGFHMLWSVERQGWVHAWTQGDVCLSAYGDDRDRTWRSVMRWLAGLQDSTWALVPGTFNRWETVA